MSKRRRLFLDIETSPLQVYVWDLNSKANAHIPHSMIVPGGESKIICVCWKWAGEKTVHSAEWSKKSHNDRRPVEKIIEAMGAATEIIGHNGDRFDIPWIRGRAIYHGLPMAPTYPTLDTLKKARQKFRFPSNRLDYLGQHLLGEGKVPVHFDLWKSIVEDDSPGGMAKMVRYCKKDVRLLESVYNKLAPYIEPITHVGEFPRDCPECGRTARIRGYRTRASGQSVVQLYCRWCPKWFLVPLGKYEKNRPLPRP